MKQEDLERNISLYIDGDLSHEDREQLEALMAENPELEALKSDLLAQKKGSQTPVPLPSPQVYEKLQQRVAKVYPGKRPAFHLLHFNKLAMAAGLMLAFLAGYFFQKQTATNAGPGELAHHSQLADQLMRAKTEYRSAINRLETLAEVHIAQMPPGVAYQVNSNLKEVDRAIKACEDFANAYPNQYMAHASLAKAYQAKVDLLQTLVDGGFQRTI